MQNQRPLSTTEDTAILLDNATVKTRYEKFIERNKKNTPLIILGVVVLIAAVYLLNRKIK